MNYQFARIDLSRTYYTQTCDWYYITDPDIDQLNKIYQQYCAYKQFTSVMPIFDCRYTAESTDVIGYLHNRQLVAFSLIEKYDNKNALCAQFAWNYSEPKIRLGINSLQTECAIYRERGFEYLYLEQAHLYKQSMQGFEILGAV
tara:strand:- start:4218 stop:4649 length:432 start_codon:yes stop_codon:yes gene_type:complete